MLVTFVFYLVSLIILLSFATIIFPIAQIKKNNGIMDIAYGPAFMVTSYILTYLKKQDSTLSPYSIVILTLITVWGVRLSYHTYMKNKNKGENLRYLSRRTRWLRKGWVYYAARAYLQIFILQAFIISLVLLPFTMSLSNSNMSGPSILFGLILWGIGFCFELIGDNQLYRFIKTKHIHKGKIMMTGLWKYTRHPNYFGESMMWFGLAFIASASGVSKIVFLSPILITGLLIFVSGIPMLEKKWSGDKDWEDYKVKTNAFIPLPPKK